MVNYFRFQVEEDCDFFSAANSPLTSSEKITGSNATIFFPSEKWAWNIYCTYWWCLWAHHEVELVLFSGLLANIALLVSQGARGAPRPSTQRWESGCAMSSLGTCSAPWPAAAAPASMRTLHAGPSTSKLLRASTPPGEQLNMGKELGFLKINC